MLQCLAFDLHPRVMCKLLHFVSAFPTGFLYFLYFTSSKTHFSTLHINFYKTPHIPLSILQYVLLKYYKIFIFYNIFSRNSAHPRHTPENLHHQQPKSIAHPMPKAGKPSNPPQVQIIKHKPSIHTYNQIKKTRNSLPKPWPPSSIQNHKSKLNSFIIIIIQHQQQSNHHSPWQPTIPIAK
jgi:hypothetical protein